MAKTQLCLRPFDVGVALHLVLMPENRYEPMARALVTSTSAVHRSVGRLRAARLCYADTRSIDADALCEFLQHGLRFAFPPLFSEQGRGIATGSAHPDLAVVTRDGTPRNLVWPSSRGDSQGEVIFPLFSGAPRVAAQDPRMHRLLAAVDLMRVGDADTRKSTIGLVRNWFTS